MEREWRVAWIAVSTALWFSAPALAEGEDNVTIGGLS